MKNQQGYILIALFYLLAISLGLISFLFKINQDRYHHIKIKKKLIENQIELKNKDVLELANYENITTNLNLIYLSSENEDSLVSSKHQLILAIKSNQFFPKPDYSYLLKTEIDKDPPVGGSLSISKSINLKNSLSLNELKISAPNNEKISLLVLGGLEIKNELLILATKNSSIEIIIAGNVKIKKVTNSNSKNSSLLIYSAKGKIEIAEQSLNLCVNHEVNLDNNSQLIAHEIKLDNKTYFNKMLGCPLKKDLFSWPSYLIIGEKN